MPSWFIYSFGSMLSFTGLALIMKKLSITIDSMLGSMLVLVFAALLNCLMVFTKKMDYALSTWEWFMLVTAGACIFVGNFLDIEAMRLAPNPGYASAIKGSQLVLITIAAYFLFSDVTLTVRGLSGVALILGGVILLALP
jgi:uncharacterized membrane protein